MKKAKISFALAVICCALAMFCCTAQAASPIISMDPGDGPITRDFILGDEIDFSKLGPAQLFLVIGTGDNETLVGDLSISIKSAVTEEFGTDVDFTVQGVSIALDTKPAFKLGKPTMFAPVATVPNELKKTIKFNTAYGFALMVVYISNLDGNIYGAPVKFTATFAMSVGVAQ